MNCGVCNMESCCVAHDSPGCADAAVQACVCAGDAWCCDTAWDSLCVQEVDEFDCGSCVECGDGECQEYAGEDCETCQEDCGWCQGDGACCEANGTPGCEDYDIQVCVCEQDPFCCNSFWDNLCAQEVEQFDCGQCSIPDSSCCSAHPEAGCDDATCQNTVCAQDPYCCESDWDQLCTDEALNWCVVCGGEPGDASDCCADGGNGSPGCQDEACQAAVCAVDPYCCNVTWDGLCADEAVEMCAVCGGIAPAWCGDGNCDPDEDCESCEADCGPCPQSSCNGNCGNYDPEGLCQCDAECFAFGDCCDDICDFCAVEYPQECCTPNCAGKTCGPDGCGGSCGTCPGGQQCNPNGQCVPIPATSCAGRCGDYDANDACQCDTDCFVFGDCCDDICTHCKAEYPVQCCTPNCAGKACGDNGCGGSCGNCPGGQQCNANGQCVPIAATSCAGRCGDYDANDACQCDTDCFVFGDCCDDICTHCKADYPQECCTPNCAGKSCGPNGCGGSCGTCPGGQQCNPNGQCVPIPATSCAGRCGEYDANDACQCDAECFGFDDCCDDICTHCKANYPVDCGNPGPNSCIGRCGQYDQTLPCQCDEACMDFGDCCTDACPVCTLPGC